MTCYLKTRNFALEIVSIMIDKSKGYLPGHTMREIIRDNNLLLMTISRFGIPFGFGDDTIEKTCRDNGVDADTFLTVCNLLSRHPYSDDNISLEPLMGYLTRTHSWFLDETLPKIRHNLIAGIADAQTDEIAMLLIKFFDDYVVEVRKHMEHENNVIFRYAEQLLVGNVDSDFNIAKYSGSHDHTVTKLNELKDIFIYHFKQRENVKLSTALFDIIICERDMMSHFEVENNLFIPAVERLECSLRANCETISEPQARNIDPEDSEVAKLSEREKEIIRCVARGMSNKEIAEKLFISAHTVATHRRNIGGKLEIHSPAALIIFALLHNIIDLKDIKDNPTQR